MLIPVYGGRGRERRVVAHAIIDDCDSWLSGFSWSIATGRHTKRAYAMRIVNGRPVRMHREILGLSSSSLLVCDHINRNGLDNRRSNLRVVTKGQNTQNRDSHRGSTSRFRGVHLDRESGMWRVKVQSDGVVYRPGRFPSEEKAALVAAELRRRHMPFSEEATACQ